MATDHGKARRFAAMLVKRPITVGVMHGDLLISCEVGHRDGGRLTHESAGGKGSVSAMEAEDIVARHKGTIERSLTQSIVESSAALLDGSFPGPWGDVAWTVRFEGKLLEGEYKGDGEVDLSAFKVAIVAESDLATALLQQELPKYKDNIQFLVKVELELLPDIETIKRLTQVISASRDLGRVTEYEHKLAAAEKRLAMARRAKGMSPEVLGRQPRVEQLRLKTALTELADVEREVAQLRGMRGRIDLVRKQAMERVTRVAEAMKQRATGKLFEKAGGQLVKKALAKFIPIYNIVSGVQDIYEVASLLGRVNWADVARRIMGEGDPGTGFGDGTIRDPSEAGTGGPGDARDAVLDEPVVGSSAVLASQLDKAERSELHATARAVLGSITATFAVSQALSSEDRETINQVVPTDLDDQELALIRKRLVAPGAAPQKAVDSVIDAIRHVRPLGKKIQRFELKAPKPATKTQTQSVPVARTKAKPEASNDVRSFAGPTYVDPVPVLKRLINVSGGKRPSLETVEFDGVTASLTSVDMSNPLVMEVAPSVDVFVTLTVLEAPVGARMRDGRHVSSGQQLSVQYQVGRADEE